MLQKLSNLILVFATILLTSCSSIGTNSPINKQPSSSTNQTIGSNTTVATSILEMNGIGYSSSSLFGSIPTKCTYRVAADGYLMPDSICTPGSINTEVNQNSLYTTICRAGGYTSSVRPPESLTEPVKFELMSAYHTDLKASQIELDHLVPLELGGSSDVANLWPEPNTGSPKEFNSINPYGYNAKDGVEGRLHDAVCSRQVTLQQAQVAIVDNWTTALRSLNISP